VAGTGNAYCSLGTTVPVIVGVPTPVVTDLVCRSVQTPTVSPTGFGVKPSALALAQEIDSQVITASTWDSLGYVRHLLGQHAAAVSCYQRAAAMFAEIGAVWYRAEVLINLGDSHEATGDRRAARELWQEALEVFERTHHPQTERLRAKMRGGD